MERKLASIRKIDKIEPIEGADAIECAHIGGWRVVIKIGDFKEEDLTIYLEIDSWVPTELAPFLSKGKEPREFNGVKGERLRTIKLRGQVSQGLLLPLSTLYERCKDGHDVTELLGVQKWERPMSAQLAGIAKGNFPSFVYKTDQERIQNLSKEFEDYKARELTFEVTEKLEGSSMTVYYNEGEFGVCSRNLDLKETEDNTFWKVANALNLKVLLQCFGQNIALQGELIGPGVQGNHYGLSKHDFRVFDIFDITLQKYWSTRERSEFVDLNCLNHAPFYPSYKLAGSMSQILDLADGGSALANVKREGLVFKCVEDPSISFKAVSNAYLLGEK